MRPARRLKKKSGRKLVAELLASSRCNCGAPALITVPRQTTNGTKWKHYCFECRPTDTGVGYVLAID